jgi:hypothetical protein
MRGRMSAKVEPSWRGREGLASALPCRPSGSGAKVGNPTTADPPFGCLEGRGDEEPFKTRRQNGEEGSKAAGGLQNS